MKSVNKAASTAYFVAAVCFYIVALINFFGVNTDFGEGVIFMGFGSAFLCLGAIFLNKEKNKDTKQLEDKE